MIVGESLWGVLNAGLIVGLSSDAPIGLVADIFALAPWLGLLGFIGAIVLLNGWMQRRSAAQGVVRVLTRVNSLEEILHVSNPLPGRAGRDGA